MDGVGKRTTALRLAMVLNCEADGAGPRVAGGRLNPCGACRPCRKILSDSHPDVQVVAPSGVFIRVEQIRAARNALALKPYEGRWRVIVISDAQAMNAEAANAFLKMLEEPPGRTILALTAPQASDLLPTIVSRCQPVRFQPIGRAALIDHLVREREMSREAAAVVAALARGGLSRALTLDPAEWLPYRSWLLERMAALAGGGDALRLALAERLAADKERLPEIMEMLKLWFRDRCVAKYDPDRIENDDLARAGRLADLPDAAAGAAIGALQRAQKKLGGNANPRLTLEALLLDLAGALDGGMAPGGMNGMEGAGPTIKTRTGRK